ncbi:hypothetical protein CDD82_14 [Ophiocordyceps australis]|uniref:RNA polymerase II assembly factor Rtp1 C-terminal domain-containing protein n=1 Tax=Ophiocordyceps australis TaxID=1399860 RepID=A0A2C5ZWI4_9HYPO|nr:hypothetical protein CDD82_14 [Ophiocordyceps australis]
MADGDSGSAQSRAVEAIVKAAKAASDPSLNDDTRAQGLKEYNSLIAGSSTWMLLPALNSLIKPSALPAWLRALFIQTLTCLPLRPDGVRAVMEFVFTVHPTNMPTPSDATQPRKQGANITHQSLALATKLLSSAPRTMTPDDWFQGISSQMFALIDGEAGPDLAKTAAQIIGFGVLGKPELGAPGKPGWNVFVEPLLECIDPCRSVKHPSKRQEADVVDLTRPQTLVTAHALSGALNRLKVLIMSNPSSGLCRRVVKPVMRQLWALASWPQPPQTVEQDACCVARQLVQTYLTICGTIDSISILIDHFLCKGSADDAELPWRYQPDARGDMEAVLPRNISRNEQPMLDWGEIELKADSLVALTASACSNDQVSAFFIYLLGNWATIAQREAGDQIHLVPMEIDGKSSVQDLVQVTLLRKLMETVPEKLVSQFSQLLEVICQILDADKRSSLGQDIMAVVLSLINLVVTAPSFQKADVKLDQLGMIQESLERLGHRGDSDVSATARNLSMLLTYRDELQDAGDTGMTLSARQIEDGKTYGLAMNYMTGDSDSPPPVVSEGLNLLSKLIVAESQALDITAVLVLMSKLLKNNEDYINLCVIKIYTQLANKHARTTVREIVDNYLDAAETSSTDVRLRFGEALTQVIERLGNTFAGELATQTCESLLSIAGRRGFRPKTMAKQAKDARLKEMSKCKGDMNGDQENANTPSDDQIMTEQERTGKDVLAQILQGWESKRGSEDVRMRTSALSILGTGFETNLGGIGPTIVSNAVDLCIHILAMEREVEYGILRRAAILVVMSFVRALNKAKSSGQSLGFGLGEESRREIQTRLRYVAETDNDGLVQQHARDVMESLENWRLASLLPRESRGLTGPGVPARWMGINAAAMGAAQPRIEELE